MLGIGFAIFVISFYFIHLPEQPNSEFKMDIYSEYSSCIGNYHEEHLSTKTNAFCLGIILCNVSRSFDYLIYPYYPAYTS